jgi:hypothetical protein
MPSVRIRCAEVYEWDEGGRGRRRRKLAVRIPP